MKVVDTLSLAWRSLSRNGMRTLLTMLGLIIGVAAVITMLALGNGAKSSVQASIASLGTNTIMVSAGSVNTGGVRSGAFGSQTLVPGDATALGEQARTLSAVSPLTQNNAQAVVGNKNWSTSVNGSGVDFPTVRNWKVARGRFFDETEVKASAKVAVLGQSVVDNLFPDGRPLGKIVRVGQVPVRVIGVLEVKGDSQFGGDQDDIVVVPYTTAMKRMFKLTGLRTILASAVDEESVDSAVDEITAILTRRHRIGEGEEADFKVRTQAEFAERAAESSAVFTALLAGIASVSLLVGGVGVMNIMLVSVTERIKEIGIRMAVGAKKADIRLQFLVESVLLSVLGGSMGIALAVGAAQLGTRLTSLPLLVDSGSVALAFGFSAAIGIFFGYYPAVKASQLDPIQALRSD
jgi:putative ABC transport system permease protein